MVKTRGGELAGSDREFGRMPSKTGDAVDHSDVVDDMGGYGPGLPVERTSEQVDQAHKQVCPRLQVPLVSSTSIEDFEAGLQDARAQLA